MIYRLIYIVKPIYRSRSNSGAFLELRALLFHFTSPKHLSLFQKLCYIEKFLVIHPIYSKRKVAKLVNKAKYLDSIAISMFSYHVNS